MTKLKIVQTYSETDAAYKLPAAEYNKFARLEKNVISRLSWAEDVQKFRQKYPAYPQPLMLQAYIYLMDGEGEKASDLYNEILEKFPGYQPAINRKIKLMMMNEQYDELEQWIDVGKTFTDQFPEREKVMLDEIISYELAAIEYLWQKSRDPQAILRARELIKRVSVYPETMQSLIYLTDIFDDWEEEDRANPAMMELLSSVERIEAGYQPMPILNHSEVYLLFKSDLSKKDIPAVLKLLNLPRPSFTDDLYVIIKDIDLNMSFYFGYHEDSTHILWLAFLLLSETADQVGFDHWVSILENDEDFIDFWFDDLLTQELFVVGYKLSGNDPERVAKAIEKAIPDSWSTGTLTTSLAMIAWFHPEKKEEVVNQFENLITKLITENPGSFKKQYGIVLWMVLDEAARLDMNRFRNYIEVAFKEMKIDNAFYDTAEQMISELSSSKSRISDRMEWKRSNEGLKQKLKRLLEKEEDED